MVADATSESTTVMVDGNYTLQANFTRKTDLNGDGVLDLRDVEIFGWAWLTGRGHDEWDGLCDLNDDGQVDWLDWAIFAPR